MYKIQPTGDISRILTVADFSRDEMLHVHDELLPKIRHVPRTVVKEGEQRLNDLFSVFCHEIRVQSSEVAHERQTLHLGLDEFCP